MTQRDSDKTAVRLIRTTSKMISCMAGLSHRPSYSRK